MTDAAQTFVPIEARPAPVNSEGLVPWIRRNLFGDLRTTIGTLLIGGLLSNSTSTNTAGTPAIRSIPLVGRLFQSFSRNDQDTELIVVVNPAILRTPVPDAALWTFPSREELLHTSVPAAAVVSKQ